MNKRNTAIIICSVLFLTAVLISGLLNGGTRIQTRDTEGRFPYTMTSDGKSITVKIKGVEEGYEWVCNRTADTIPQLVSQRANEKGSEFVVTTSGGIVQTVTFSLRNKKMPESVIYDIFVSLSADPDGNVNVLDSSHAESEGIERVTSGTDMSYYIIPGEDGVVLVRLDEASASDWYIVSDKSSTAVVNTTTVSDSELEVSIKSIGSGECPVFICNEKRGAAIYLDVLTSDLGYAEIIDFGSVPLSEAVIDTYIYSETDISGGDIISKGDIE